MSDETEIDHAAPAFQVGETLERLQRAVARLAKSRRTGQVDVVRVLRADLDRARLNVLATAPGSLVVEIQPHSEPLESEDSDAPSLPVGHSTWAEQAIIDLIRALPENDNDDAALDAIALASPVMRRAVSDLVLNRRGPLIDVELLLTEPDAEPIRSRLTQDQAKALRRTLDIASEERHTEFRRGRLDGVRTRRRLFYLETQAEGEIHGLIDEDLMPAVLDAIDQTVDVEVEVVVTRSRSGRPSPRRYRLVSIGQQQTLLVRDAD